MEEKARSAPTIDSKPSRRVHVADVVDDGRQESTDQKKEQLADVKILGTILDKRFFRSEGKVDYGVISVDDGSGLVIQIKTWGNDTKMLGKVGLGDMVDVVGKVKYKDGTAYVVPLIVRKIDDPNWETLRELEIIRDRLRRNKIRPTSSLPSTERLVNVESKVLELIESADSSTGVAYGELIEGIEHSAEDEVKKALKELLTQGRIYESRPGRYKK
jgi:RPA family protein